MLSYNCKFLIYKTIYLPLIYGKSRVRTTRLFLLKKILHIHYNIAPLKYQQFSHKKTVDFSYNSWYNKFFDFLGILWYNKRKNIF